MSIVYNMLQRKLYWDNQTVISIFMIIYKRIKMFYVSFPCGSSEDVLVQNE